MYCVFNKMEHEVTRLVYKHLCQTPLYSGEWVGWWGEVGGVGRYSSDDWLNFTPTFIKTFIIYRDPFPSQSDKNFA